MKVSLFDLLIFVGMIQGVIISTLLFKTKKNTVANTFLAFFLLTNVILSIKPLFRTLALWEMPLFRYFPIGLELATAPFMYFYIKALLTPKFHFKRKDWLHFVPVFIAQTYAFVVYFSVLPKESFSEKDHIAELLHFQTIKLADRYLLGIAMVIYLYYAYCILMRYKKKAESAPLENNLPNFTWLKNVFQISGIIVLFFLINRCIDLTPFRQTIGLFHWKAFDLFMIFLIYYFGLKGYLQPHYSFIETITHPSTSTITNAKSVDISKQIEQLMKEDKLFLNPKLGINTLSKQLDLLPKDISFAVNQHFQVSFRDYINSYRIEEVKSKLNSSDYQHMTILGIALESGFNSEASFYRVFKKHEGMTPKAYIRQKEKT